MTFYDSRILLSLCAAMALAGCNGATTGGGGTLISIPTTPAPAYDPPVSESYVIQRAPSVQPPLATLYDPFSDPFAQPQEQIYVGDDLFEVAAAEDARREADARRLVLAELEARAGAQRNGAGGLSTDDFAPFEDLSPDTSVAEIQPDEGADAMAEAQARAAAAEAQAAELAAELARAREAVAEAEAAASAAEDRARRMVRERVAKLSAERESTARDRANPTLPNRRVLGRYATRPAVSLPSERTQSVAPPPPPQQRVAIAPPPPIPAPPRPIVEQAPIPGLKPYILARSALPSAKPRRAPPSRSFDVGTASVLAAPGAASLQPPDVSISREPGADLSAQFFPTPGKPSTLGTDQDAPLDLAAIDATPYGIGADINVAVDDGSAKAEWADAVNLIESGEVEALAILEDADLVLTLCSGRSILTTPPDLASAATLTAPQIICGQNKPLALR